ncbi:MFS transporter [Actinoplanes couchii]|uniref:MFS-type transporter YfiS n=1 Tax=Actinoplanes couchii TaxID=403638 RepID=A0ABQ3XTD2_9ACTN|nr:MFS transporter [Actinoplanes couchii]MDR6324147.1 MFS family permease [Actinoplanes couchii]GID61765.1 putative MFS-type transporter YfiS [Actinoplanes couchii]
MFQPLRLPAFRRLYTAQVVGNFGDGLDYLAIITIVVFQWHRGPGDVALLALAGAAPMVFGAPVIGLVADRFQPRTVMVAANAVRALAIVGITTTENFALLCVLSGLATVCGGFFNAAEQRFIRYRVRDDLLLQTNSLRSVTERMLTGLAGPGVAAVLIGVWDARITLLICASLFLLSAVLVGFVGTVPADGDSTEERAESWRRRIGAAFAVVWGNPPLRLTVGAISLAYLFSTMFEIMIPVWYREMGAGPSFTGTAMVCMGLGGGLGALLLSRVGDRFNLLLVMATAATMIGVLVGAMGIAGYAGLRSVLGVWLIAAVIIGLGAAVAAIVYGTLVQRLTPAHLMGRVGALTGAAVVVPVVVGPAVAPILTPFIGINGIFLLSGTGILAVGLMLLVFGPVYRDQVRPRPAGADAADSATNQEVKR